MESDEESESNSSSFKNCTMTFKTESSANRSICMVYISVGRPGCGFDWTLLVLRHRNSLDPSNILYELVCGTDPRSGRPHAWCAPYDLDQITLVHKVIFSLPLFFPLNESYVLTIIIASGLSGARWPGVSTTLDFSNDRRCYLTAGEERVGSGCQRG